ncbi:MAG TPA: YfbK domain-containing protein, partial [Lysobacter sp.]
APLRYGTAAAPATASGEIAHLRLRYKQPGQDTSRLIETPILASSLTRAPGEAMRFASAVAGFADALRGGERMDGWSWDAMIATARGARGSDPRGERAEMLQLMDAARQQVAADARVGVSR